MSVFYPACVSGLHQVSRVTCVCARTQVREFVQREVEPLDKEVEQIQIMALCQVLCAAWIATAASPRMGPSTCGQCEAARALPFMKLGFIAMVLLCVVWVSSGGVGRVDVCCQWCSDAEPAMSGVGFSVENCLSRPQRRYFPWLLYAEGGGMGGGQKEDRRAHRRGREADRRQTGTQGSV